MTKLLLEDTLGEFQVDRSKGQRGIITESDGNGSTLCRVPGRFSVCNITNGNNRQYPRKVWENNLSPESKLRKLIETNAAFGLLEHPDDGRVDLNSPICVITTKAILVNEGVDTVVEGELVIVGTSEGQKLKALIEAGYNPFVSSRGYGSLDKGPNGVDIVQDDYVCEGWDVVYQPSFSQAALRPSRSESVKPESVKPEPELKPRIESKPAVEAQEKPTPTVSLTETETAKKLPEATGSPAESKPKQNTAMDQKQIRLQLESVRASVAGKPDHRLLTEAVEQCNRLHNETATWAAEDATRSWEATKLHESIKAIEDSIANIQNAPSKQLNKLQEDHKKCLEVTKVALDEAVALKKRLATKLIENKKMAELNSKLLERGRGWKKRAEAIKETDNKHDFQLDVVSEALDMLVEMYNTDITKLSVKLIPQKFGELVTEDVAKRLKKARHPNQVYAIHEELSANVKKLKTQGSKITESKNDAKESKGKLKNEDKKASDATLKIEAVKDPRSLSESVGIAKRLSSALVSA